MLNTTKNANIVGVLLILFGVYDFLNAIRLLAGFFNRGNSIAAEDLIAMFMMFAVPIVGLIVGFGLFKSKLWSVYGTGVLALVRIISLVWAASQEATLKTANFFEVGIYILLFIWFYSNRKQFTK